MNRNPYGSIARDVLHSTMGGFRQQEQDASVTAHLQNTPVSRKRVAGEADMAPHEELQSLNPKRQRAERVEVKYQVSENAARSLPESVIQSIQLACRGMLPMGPIDIATTKIAIGKCIDEFSVRVTGIARVIDCTFWRRAFMNIPDVTILSSYVSFLPPDGPSITATFRLEQKRNTSQAVSGTAGLHSTTETQNGSILTASESDIDAAARGLESKHTQAFRMRKISTLKAIVDNADEKRHEWAIPSLGRLIPSMDSELVCTALSFLKSYRAGSTPYPLNISVAVDKETGERIVPKEVCKGARHMSEKEGKPHVYWITIGKLHDLSLADLDTIVALMPFHMTPVRVNLDDRTLTVALRSYCRPLRVRWTVPTVAPITEDE